MRLERNPNGDYQFLSDKDLAKAKKEFTRRGFRERINKVSGKAHHEKFIAFEGENLPNIFILKRKDGTPTNSLMIHPLTPKELMRFRTIPNGNSPYFCHSNTGFPKLSENVTTSEYLRVLFHSEEELGEILNNLIEIKRGTVPESYSETSKGKIGTAESVSPLQDSPASDLVTEVVTEGGKKLIFTYKYERNPRLKKQALQEYGYSCSVCGFDFEETYGALGKEFAEVHHIVPVSEGERENDYRNLVPLCPNCHRMIHRLYKDLMPQQYGDAVEILRNKLKR